MTISFTDVTLCGGGNHVTLKLTQDGEARTIHLDTSELRHDMTQREIIKALGIKHDDRDIDALYLVYQALKTAEANTLVKKRNAILAIQDATVQTARA
jgi:hypothetical protein